MMPYTPPNYPILNDWYRENVLNAQRAVSDDSGDVASVSTSDPVVDPESTSGDYGAFWAFVDGRFQLVPRTAPTT